MDLLFLQETEIRDIYPEKPPQFNNDITVCPKKDTKNKTRIILLIKEDLKMKVRDDLMCMEISSIWVELLSPNQSKTLVGSLYREFDIGLVGIHTLNIRQSL